MPMETDMNAENLRILADHVEKLPMLEKNKSPHSKRTTDAFSMGTWHNMKKMGCGAVACLGGWSSMLFLTPDQQSDVLEERQSLGGENRLIRDALGLNSEQMELLFYPKTAYWEDIQPAQAASVVRNLIATGKVDWTPVYDALHEDGFLEDHLGEEA